MSEKLRAAELLRFTAKIVAAHVSYNSLPPADLPQLIETVHEALAGSGEAPAPEPAVPVGKSVTPNHIVCLEDGKKLKMLRRHLRTAYDMSPEEYREKWGLRPDYPMVAPAYAKLRSELARSIGLGKKHRKARTKARRRSGAGKRSPKPVPARS